MKKHANKKSKTQAIDLDINEAIKIKERLKNISAGTVVISKDDEEIFQTAAQLIGTLVSIYGMWSKSKKKINRLLKMVFGSRSEKLKDLGAATSNDTIGDDDEKKKKKKKRKDGGGKNSADDYESAAEITCNLDDDKLPGETCPECSENKLYEIEPKKVIRLVGNAPVSAFKFILQQVRCICGATFTADVGDEFREIYNEDKYGPSALAAMMIYKFLMGVSFGTLASIQKMNGVPLPASTQANKIKNDALPTIQLVVEELKKLATNATALGFDDTVIKTLEKRLTKQGGETHRGHGTAIIANGFDSDDNEIVLFDFNSSKHAGDVVCELLSGRERDSLPLLISDGLNSYDECKKSGIDVNCNTHARRKVVEEDPERKSYVGQAVLDCYSNIYKNDAFCKGSDFSPLERMEYHRGNSTFHFEKIQMIFNIITNADIKNDVREKYQIPDYLAADEPNSDLCGIANYFLNRYHSLTKVLDLPGVPLDTNYVERMIKVVIRIRKNSLFFNSVSSACYSGEILSLLETAVQNGVNVFDYVNFLLANKKDVNRRPRNYLPWLYKLSENKKRAYWKKVDRLMTDPSSFWESANGESCHSSA